MEMLMGTRALAGMPGAFWTWTMLLVSHKIHGVGFARNLVKP